MTVILTMILFLLALQDNLIVTTGISFINYIDEIIITVLAIIAIISIVKKHTVKTFHFKLLMFILIFLIIGSFSCYLNSSFIFKNTLMSGFLSTKFWILVLTVSLFSVSESNIKKYYKALFILEKIVILFAIINIVSLNTYQNMFPLSHITYRFNIIAVCSIFNHPGKYGWFMLFCALAHFSIYKKDNNKSDLYKTLIAIVACLLSLRTKVIMSIIGCFACYAIYVNRVTLKMRIKRIIIVSGLSLLLLIPFKGIVYNTYVLYFTDSEGYSVRQALLDNSIQIMKDYFPIGVGFGKYGTWYASQVYSEYYYKYGMNHMYGLTQDNTSYATDTFWPAIFGETGISGSIIYILMIILLFKQLNKINKDSNKLNNDIALFSLLVLLQLLIESFGSASFNGPPEYFFSAVTIGLSIARYNTLRRGGIDEENSNV